MIDQNPAAALALLGQVIAQAEEEALAATALAEVGYVLTQADLPAPVRANAEAMLDEAVNGSQPALRAATLRALVAVRQGRGDGAGALDAASSLVATADPEDVFFGRLAQVYLYADAGHEAEAWAALAEVEAQHPESTEAVLARHRLEGSSGASGEGRAAPTAVAPAAPTGAKAADAEMAFRLDPVYPNPTQRGGTVSFVLAEAAEVRVMVYDVLGRAVAALADGAFEPGAHALTLDAAGLPSGVYLVRLMAGDAVATQQITVLQ